MDGLSFFQANAWKKIVFTPQDTHLEQARARLLCEEALHNIQIASIEVDFPYTTLIPSHMLTNQEALSVYTFHFPETETTPLVVCTQPIPAFNITLLFGIPLALYTLSTQLFEQVQWKHCLISHLDTCLRQSKQNGNTQACILAHKEHMHIAITNNGSLMFSNYFPIAHQQDYVFFTAKVFEQYQLSQQQTPTFIVGNKEAYNTLVKHLAKCQYTEEDAHC